MPSNSRGIFKATLLIVLSACCFGSLTTVTLLAMQSGLSLLNAIFWRFAIAALLLFFLTRQERQRNGFNKAAIRLMAIGGIAQALISYLSFKALDFLPVGALAFLFYTYPAWVAIIAAARGKESFTKIRIIALAISMAGIAVMVGTPQVEAFSTLGLVMALATAFLYALYLPLIDEAQRSLPSMLSTFYLVSGIAITFLIVTTLKGELALPHTAASWGSELLLSTIGTVLAFATLMSGLRVLGPVRTSIISTVEPFFTAILGAVVLGQSLTMAIVAGGILIATAVIILEQSSERGEAVADISSA